MSLPMTDLPLVEFAQQYVRNGWKVVPLHTVADGSCSCRLGPGCKSPGKHPRLPNGVHGASSEPSQIAGWWHRWPNANVGIATGRESGVWVLDIDPRNGGDKTWEDLQGKLPRIFALTASTGGGGSHLFFRYPDDQGVSNGKLGDGIDIKADGGFVVAAPSIHASGKTYEWETDLKLLQDAPDALLAVVRRHPDKSYEESCPSTNETEQGLDARKIADITRALATVAADDRDLWLRVGMAIHSEDSSNLGFATWDEWSRKSSKHDIRDSRRVWRSFNTDRIEGVTLSTLFGIAKEHGVDVTQQPVIPKSRAEVYAAKRAEAMPPELLKPPGVLAEIVAYTTSTAVRPQAPLAVAGAFSLAATVCGRHYETASGLRSNLYLVGMGPTGCGKNHARSIIKRILHQANLDEFLGGEEIASGQSILTRAYLSPNVLFQLDEFGLLMEAVQNPNSATHLAAIMGVLMKLFSSADCLYGATEYADQEKRPRVLIEYPCVNLHATTTPDSFYRAMRSKHVVSGYLNRLIVVRTDEKRPARQKKRGPNQVPRSILDWITAITQRSTGGRGNVGSVNPETPFTVLKTREADALFDEFDHFVGERMDAASDTGLDPLWNRAWEHADKLALVCALASDPHSPVVREDHAAYAIRFARWSIESLCYSVQAHVADSAFDAKVKDVYRAIAESGERGLTERELGRRSAYRRLPPRDRAEVLAALKAGGEIALVDVQTGAKGGRPRAAYIATDPDATSAA